MGHVSADSCPADMGHLTKQSPLDVLEKAPTGLANEIVACSTSAQTRFNASVTSSGEWRATYSRKAAVNTSLRVLWRRRARRSTFSRTSSGTEMDVFISVVYRP